VNTRNQGGKGSEKALKKFGHSRKKKKERKGMPFVKNSFGRHTKRGKEKKRGTREGGCADSLCKKKREPSPVFHREGGKKNRPPSYLRNTQRRPEKKGQASFLVTERGKREGGREKGDSGKEGGRGWVL